MVRFTATLKKFDSQGEKTGWTYIDVPAKTAQELKPDNKKSFRVKGKIDNHKIAAVALVPMGEGNFILAVNATMRKAIKKQKGANVTLQLAVDEQEILPPAELMECLQDEPLALKHFKGLPKSHQNYFTRWIDSAKTEPTRAKRIAQAVNAMVEGKDFGEMARAIKAMNESSPLRLPRRGSDPYTRPA